LVAVLIPNPASAITNDKLALLTFTGSVQVPGVTLTAGTYRFHLADPESARSVLQVLSSDGAIVHAMFLTRADSRTKLTDDPSVTFIETPAGVPPAVRTLFYGGEYRGYEFVYPKGGPIMTAEERPQPEITYTPAPAAPIAEPIAEPIPEPIPEPVAEQAPEPVAPPVELPRTASPLPLVALGGAGSLVAGVLLRLRRRRS
jgi:hypothetical protein